MRTLNLTVDGAELEYSLTDLRSPKTFSNEYPLLRRGLGSWIGCRCACCAFFMLLSCFAWPYCSRANGAAGVNRLR